jgi:glycosyltransferase involved in cell wall biosynthesis
MTVFSSTIIATINRSTLSRAVDSVLDQDFQMEDFEVIVVNDSGSPLPEMEWMQSQCVRVIDTNRHERSVARNTGAAIAKGRYLHFLDDDDILLPGSLHAFWELDQIKGDAIWLSGSYQSVDNHGVTIENIHPENDGNNFAFLVSGEGIPLQASLLDSRYFYRVGCYDPKINVCEDRDLGRRFAMVGSICHTNALVAQIRVGIVGSTTDWSILAAADRSSRENAFKLPHSFNRLWASAKTCRWHGQVKRSYWHGRVCRSYFASMVWNLKQGNLLVALSRAMAGLAFMNVRIFAGDFWRGMRQTDLFTGGQILQTFQVDNDPVPENQLILERDDSE